MPLSSIESMVAPQVDLYRCQTTAGLARILMRKRRMRRQLDRIKIHEGPVYFGLRLNFECLAEFIFEMAAFL